MATPVYAFLGAALVARRAAGSFWIRFQPHREVSSTLGISLVLHLAVFVIVGSTLFDAGEDDEDVPEVSVQLVTREGPSSEEYTEAAAPMPLPAPVEDVIDDPGTAEETLVAENVAGDVPLQDVSPDALLAEHREPMEVAPVEAGSVITTTGESEYSAPVVEEPTPVAVAAEIPKPEQEMLSRNVQQMAQQLLDSDLTKSEVSWQQDGQQYSARILRQPAADSTGIEQVIAEVMTHKNGKRMKTRLSLKRLAFSHFTQLVNHWDRNIMLHDDVIDGRFHSNTEFAFSKSRDAQPRFFGKVTTAAATLTFNGFNRRRDKDVFQGGYETKTDRVTLPKDLPEVINGGEEADRRVFTKDTRVIFNADGSYVWRLANGDGPLHREEPSPRPRYLVGEKGAKIYVRGTVAGIFTVYTPDDIEIEDDLVYQKDPRQAVLSRDFLALIAGSDVAIASPEVTGPGDLTVHAAIFARRRFYIEFTDRGADNTLFIYGSLTAGTLSETEPRYATKIDFDKRFEYLRPASFPMTRRYEVDSWDHDWQEVQEPGQGTGNLARSN